jgi:hypothetical protein
VGGVKLYLSNPYASSVGFILRGFMKRQKGFSSNVGIETESGFIAVGDIYVPKPEHLENSYIRDVAFKVLQIFNGECVMFFLHNNKDTTVGPEYLLRYYRKISPVEREFYGF